MYTLTKAHAALADIAESKGRPVLESVCVKPGHIVAADGFMLLDVALPTRDTPADAPSVLIPAPAFKAALGTLKAAKTNTQHAYLAVDGTLTTPSATHNLPLTEGTYPDVEAILNDQTTGEPVASIVVDAKRLADLLTAMVKAGVNETHANAVRIDLRSESRAVMLYGKDGDGNQLRAALMPVVIGDGGNGRAKDPKPAAPKAEPEPPAPKVPDVLGTGEYGYRFADDGTVCLYATRDERDREAALCDGLEIELIDPEPTPEPDDDCPSPERAAELVADLDDQTLAYIPGNTRYPTIEAAASAELDRRAVASLAPVTGADHDSPATHDPEPEDSADAGNDGAEATTDDDPFPPYGCDVCGRAFWVDFADCPNCGHAVLTDYSEPEPPAPVSGGDHPTYTVTVERSSDRGRTYALESTTTTDDPTTAIPAHATPLSEHVYLARNGHHLMRWTVTALESPTMPQDESAPEIEESAAPNPPDAESGPGCPDVTLLQEQADFARTLVDQMPQTHDADAYTAMPFSRVFAGDLTAEGMIENLVGYLDQLVDYILGVQAERTGLERDIESAGRALDDALIYRDSTRLEEAYRELTGSRPMHEVPRFAA